MVLTFRGQIWTKNIDLGETGIWQMVTQVIVVTEIIQGKVGRRGNLEQGNPGEHEV